jgi:hypothetical protein
MSRQLKTDVRKKLRAKATGIPLTSFAAGERRKPASAWDFIRQGLSLIAGRNALNAEVRASAPNKQNQNVAGLPL